MFLLQVTFLAAFTFSIAMPASGIKSIDKNNLAHKNPLMRFQEKFQTKVLNETGKTLILDTDTVSLKQYENLIAQ
jgi:hypothetical protein